MNIPFIDLKAQQARISEDLKQRIDAVLAHGAYIQGPEVDELEERLSEFCGARHTVCVSNGTDALLLSLMVEGIGRGDAVFLPAFTFTATAEVCLLLGAQPVFVDVDPATFNIDPNSLEAAIKACTTQGELIPRAVIAVDLFGLPADYVSLRTISERHGLYVIADAAQSFGATQGKAKVGTLADITTTSFFPAKPLGCFGDGGAVFTDNAEVAQTLRSMRAHGKGGEKYDIVRVGLNARLDTIQAAILLAKLNIFADELVARERVARHYDARLSEHVTIPARQDDRLSAWAQYTIQVSDRDDVGQRLKAEGIPSAIYYPRPMHRQTAYLDCPTPVPLDNAEQLSERVLSLPMHPYLTDQEVERICDGVVAALG